MSDTAGERLRIQSLQHARDSLWSDAAASKQVLSSGGDICFVFEKSDLRRIREAIAFKLERLSRRKNFDPNCADVVKLIETDVGLSLMESHFVNVVAINGEAARPRREKCKTESEAWATLRYVARLSGGHGLEFSPSSGALDIRDLVLERDALRDKLRGLQINRSPAVLPDHLDDPQTPMKQDV